LTPIQAFPVEKTISTGEGTKAAVPEFDHGEAVIGLGTVWNAAQAQAAVNAGAQFIVSPTTRLTTIEMCNQMKTAVMPGAFTADGNPDSVGGRGQRREGVLGPIGGAA
jgi:2-dehydro-3-deoxyphosphogluconate aldolase/(4S)-4-hydroxy-2-oxoglutarate aldolase